MTIEEMRKEIADYSCDEYDGCTECPHYLKGFCYYDEQEASDDIIREWHKEFFPEQYANSAVNHPSHYQGKHECIDEMIALFGVEAVKNFCMCNVYKYRFRAAKKNGQEDLDKADWYMDKLLELNTTEVSE